MNILGLDYISGSYAIILISGNPKKHSIVDIGIKKITLPSYPASIKDINSFEDTISTYIKTYSIDLIMIPQKQTKGPHRASLSFFWEGVLSSKFGDKVKTVHNATTRATDRKKSDLKLSISPKYLNIAYDVAFEGLK